MPNPPIDGGAQVMHFTTKGLLANGIHLKTVAINPTRNYIDPNTIPLEYRIDTKFECVTVDTAIKPWNFFTNIFRSESYFTERFNSLEFKNKLIEILEKEQFDVIQLEHLYVCKYLDVLKKHSNAKILLRPQNVEYIIWERFLKSIKNPLKKSILKLAISRLKKYEQNIISKLDGVIALTKEDSDLFKSFSPKTKVIIIPMGYDYENLVNYDFDKQFKSKPIIYHLGSMDWMPNIEAMEWFLKKVLPLLENNNFQSKIVIAGRKMPLSFYEYKSEILDIVDEVNAPLEFQEDKQIMIVPLWSGSGIRAKIIEGLALGKTIIATTIGAQGIEYDNGENLIIADTPEKFANQIIRCVNSEDLRRKISKNARSLSLQNYHYKNTAKKMVDFYDKLMNTNE